MIRINLVRDRPPLPARPTWPRSSLIVALAAIVLVAVHVIQGATLASLRDRRDRLSHEVVARESAQRAQAASEPSPIPDPLPADGPALSARRLRHLAAVAPAELWIVSYRERDNEITIEGISRGDGAVQLLTSKLSGTAAFGQMEIAAATRRETSDLTEYAFTLVSRSHHTKDAQGGMTKSTAAGG